MNVTVNGITAKVEWEGFRKSRGDDGPRVVIRYQVGDITTADTFADSVMGGIIVTGGPHGTVNNLPRQPCPTNPRIYALSADVDYFGERTDETAYSGGLPVTVPGFESASVTVVYGLLTWSQTVNDDPGGEQSFTNDQNPGEPFVFAECEIDHAVELITVRNGGMKFVTAPNLPIDAPIAIRSPISTWRIVRHLYPNLPSAKVMTMIGNTNNATFLGQGLGCVLFDDCRTKQVMTPDGTRCQGFEMIFKVKPRDWNMFVRPDTMIWDWVADGSGTRPYQQINLNPLVQ